MFVADDCRDKNQYCPDWAAAGECERNPQWMTANCLVSCNVCDPDTGQSPPPPTTHPNSHRIRGVHKLGSPSSPESPYLGKKMYHLSRVLVTTDNYNITKKTHFFLGKFSRDYAPQIPPFPRKWENAYGPLMHSSGEGGGGVSVTSSPRQNQISNA